MPYRDGHLLKEPQQAVITMEMSFEDGSIIIKKYRLKQIQWQETTDSITLSGTKSGKCQEVDQQGAEVITFDGLKDGDKN